MDGSGIDHEVDIVRDVFRLLGISIVNAGALAFQKPGEGGMVPIRAGYRKTLGEENFRKAAHADAAYTDEINV